jgi:hypothetical protein
MAEYLGRSLLGGRGFLSGPLRLGQRENDHALQEVGEFAVSGAPKARLAKQGGFEGLGVCPAGRAKAPLGGRDDPAELLLPIV